jgi:CubicO group peptidase (beta-lactamase class C family)
MKKIVMLLVILSSNFCFAQSDYTELIEYYNKEKNFNGAVLIAKNGVIEYSNYIGISDRKKGEKINSNTTFKIASITKTFTAVLILQLYEQGKIDLKVPFGKYYPTYKGNAKNLASIEHLLTYSSGIPNTAEKYAMKPYQEKLSLDQFIDKYCSENIENTPGTVSNYSNTDYIILHKIIELVSKKSYSTMLSENILKPLELKNTGLLNATLKLNSLSNSYTINDSTHAINLDEQYLIENYFGAGSLYSTVEDLLKFDNAIFNNKLLKKATSELMLSPNDKLNGVAFGVWYAGGYGTFSKPFIYRTGGILGACSNWIHTLEDNKTIIVFNNTNGTNLYELSEQLYLISNGEKSTVLNETTK